MEGTFKEFTDWWKDTGCSHCINCKLLFTPQETNNKDRKFEFKFKCEYYKRFITPKDKKLGWHCKAKIE